MGKISNVPNHQPVMTREVQASQLPRSVHNAGGRGPFVACPMMDGPEFG